MLFNKKSMISKNRNIILYLTKKIKVKDEFLKELLKINTV